MGELLVAEKYARGLVRLLKEYAQKLGDLTAERERLTEAVLRRQVQSVDLTGLNRRVQLIRPALLNVTREASQLAEQGDIRDIDRLELRLRLAEVEGLLSSFATPSDRTASTPASLF